MKAAAAVNLDTDLFIPRMATVIESTPMTERERYFRIALSEPLAHIANRCESIWGQREETDKVLLDGLTSLPQCLFMYALDSNGIQLSDNVCKSGLMPEHYGRDRSDRPGRSVNGSRARTFSRSRSLPGARRIDSCPSPLTTAIPAES